MPVQSTSGVMKTEEQVKQLLDRCRRDALLLQESYSPTISQDVPNREQASVQRLI